MVLGLAWLSLGMMSVEAIKYETTAEKSPEPSEFRGTIVSWKQRAETLCGVVVFVADGIANRMVSCFHDVFDIMA